MTTRDDSSELAALRSQVETLKAELVRVNEACDTAEMLLQGERDVHAELLALQAAVREVRAYVQHARGCDILSPDTILAEPGTYDPDTEFAVRRRTANDPPVRCTCGLDTVLAGLDRQGTDQTEEPHEGHR